MSGTSETVGIIAMGVASLAMNSRTEYAYRPINDPADVDRIARTHFEALSRDLASYLAKEPANSRPTARQSLTQLTRQQFQALSTDVHDELARRKNNADTHEVPCLPLRDDVHPKHDQAPQKLAAFSTARFKDLSGDVYHELARRHPELKDEVIFLHLSPRRSTHLCRPPPSVATRSDAHADPTRIDIYVIDVSHQVWTDDRDECLFLCQSFWVLEKDCSGAESRAAGCLKVEIGSRESLRTDGRFRRAYRARTWCVERGARDSRDACGAAAVTDLV
ncbi:hypothetical protein EW146_g5386 [Bondarzewia mesenterica]|uniref:GIT Spa2 homology (SHD) domain-containing protein n=1 Tax=Bondarzewia mesenterica TaxID=1095465 RepID=A0A4S4LRK5_9AGAM|nr:hypothetical protein EW146_g5386 [Bondarzewia mesenterica]